jgi:hypothetical protein
MSAPAMAVDDIGDRSKEAIIMPEEPPNNEELSSLFDLTSAKRPVGNPKLLQEQSQQQHYKSTNSAGIAVIEEL